jgi:putative ABC transport system permease protein
VTPLEYIRIAVDSISQNKVRSLLTMLGVIIGVMSVILLVSFGEAAQIYVEREFSDMGTNTLLVTPGKQETTGIMPMVAGSVNKLTYANAKEIARRARGVKGVSPAVIGAAPVSHNDRTRNTMIIGGTPEAEEVRNIRAQVGRFLTQEDVDRNNRVCMLGVTVKRELFGNDTALNKWVTINETKHLVVGIMEPKGNTLGFDMDDMVIIPLTSAQQLFYQGEDELFQIVVSANSPEDVDVAAESIHQILYEAHDYTEDFTVTDQRDMLSTFDRIFSALKIMLAGIASISLLVGGIGIMNIMLVSVRERTREVGVRMAVGATRGDIGMQFVIESMTLSAFGGLIGIGVGFAAAWFIRALYPAFPVYMSTWSVLMAFLFSSFVGVFFGVYPALKAASVDPVEALRYE